jgi:sulfatase modifying factor 1
MDALEMQQATKHVTDDMVWIPGGTFTMGSDRHYPEEAPTHRVTVDGFWMDRHTVTNAQFRRFVEETGHVTFCEKPAKSEDYPGADPALLAPASVVFIQPLQRVDMRNHYNWWTYVGGANWRHPEGPDAYEDVEAYAAWAGKVLASEAEWEFAARGGLDGAEYAWGDEFAPGGAFMANTWQGEFPVENLGSDGFAKRAPVGSFAPNGYGLYDMIGNVWEWTADWYGAYRSAEHACCGQINPHGGKRAASYDPALSDVHIPRKVLKGGSFLCAANYCVRYRPAARMPQAVDTSTCHSGFRLIVRSA